jgi:LL-diaminopimelate aminotransferase
MARVNENYGKLQAGYLFPEIGRRVSGFCAANPDAKIIRLGIGDITLPLAPAVVEALRDAAAEMGTEAGIHGYGPDRGYDFLIDAILEHDFKARGIEIAENEIFVSDGSKQDSGNIQEIFAHDCSVAVTDPCYPVYVDTNVMAGRTGNANQHGAYEGIRYLPATEANHFAPSPPEEPVDLAYLCSPNNPTGSVMSRENLTAWVSWARNCDAILIFDAAYDAFIQDDELPRSIYEIAGARECAIEMRSFSKRAGFTGVRCAYTIIPRELEGSTVAGNRTSIADLWERRQATKYNCVPYVVQRGAAAVYSPEGQKQTHEQVAYYMRNAAILREGLHAAGFTLFGGEHAPYVWLKTPNEISSWDFFSELLTKAHVVSTPGSGFGAAGEGYIRISAFNSRANVEQAVERIQRVFTG